MRRVFGTRPLISSETQPTRILLSCSMTFLRKARRSIIVHFRLASSSIGPNNARHLKGRAARGTKITRVERLTGPWCASVFTSVEHRRFTWLCATGVGKGRALVIIETPSSGKKGWLGRSCSHGRNSSRQVNLPRGSSNPPSPPRSVARWLPRKKESTLLPLLEQLSRASICLSALTSDASPQGTRVKGTLKKCSLSNHCESFRWW